ncbi:uncharacterized protein ACWYII_034595 [Salvelinus alpinus]
METSVPQAITTQSPPALSDYFPTTTPKRCQWAQDFFPPPPVEPIVAELPNSPAVKRIMVDLPISPPVEPIVVELPVSPPVKPIVDGLAFSPPVKPIVVELPVSPPAKPIVVDLPISPPVKHITVELPIFPPVNHQDQPDQWANWGIEAGSSQIVDVPAYLPLPTSSDVPQQSPQEQPGVLTESPELLANVGTLKEMIEIAWQKCQEYQSKFFMWCCVTLLCTQSRAQPIFPPVKPIVVDRPISPPVKHIMFELPIVPPVKPIVVEHPISPPVESIVVELPISQPLKPILVELPISPPVKPIVVELPIAPVEAESLQRFDFAPPPRKNKPLKGLTQRHRKRQKDMETSVPQARTTQPRPALSDFFPPPPVEPIVVELPISPPVKHAMFELPIAPVEAESLQRFEGCQWAQHFLNSPPPQGCQTAQNGVNPYSMRAGAPMGKYPGYPCTTTKAGSGISDAALVHMLRPLSPMCVPKDDGGWNSAGDHMSLLHGKGVPGLDL